MHSAILFVLLSALICIEAIPKISPPCKDRDEVCFTKLCNDLYRIAIAGDPTLGLESLDPAKIDLIKEKFGTLEYKLSNITLQGFKDCVIKNASLAEDHRQISFVMICPLLKMKGNYECKGEIFSIYIDGSGPLTLECKDYLVTVVGKTSTLKRDDGKEYLSFKNYRAYGDLLGGFTFRMDNLFNGQKELEETFYRVINENWKEVSTELQEPLVNVNVKSTMRNLNKLLKAVTSEAIHG